MSYPLIISNTGTLYLMPLVLLRGVSFPFDRAPAYQAQAWITWKCIYAMGATAVCDHEGNFTSFATRYVGSMHDSLASRMCGLNRHEDDYFQEHDYLLADAAYTSTETVLPRYRSELNNADKPT